MRKTTSILLPILAAACAGSPATPEQQRLAERQLLAPFVRDVKIGCAELVVEMTRNFHGHVGQPAVDTTVHEFRKEKGDGFVDSIWTNTLGDSRTAFTVTLGERAEFGEGGLAQGAHTRFTVLNQVRMRVYQDARNLTLSARASGPVVLVQEASAQPSQVREFAVVDGVLQRQ